MRARNTVLTMAVAGALGALATAALAHGPGWGGASCPATANCAMAGAGPMMGMGGMGMRGGPNPQFAQALGALRHVLRQVAHEGKVLAVQPAGCQGQHQ